MAVASAGFRLAHAVLHQDIERAASLAKEITATTRKRQQPSSVTIEAPPPDGSAMTAGVGVSI
jgi:hypothetical protein